MLNQSDIRETVRYSDTGLPTQKVDALGYSGTLMYDDRDIAMIRETNALGWNTEYTYDYPTGKVSAIKNPNDVTSKIEYDLWGREVARSRFSDGAGVRLMTREYDDIHIPNSSTETTYYTAEGDSKTNVQYSDGWGRPIMSLVSTEKPDQYSAQQIRYDTHGNPTYT